VKFGQPNGREDVQPCTEGVKCGTGVEAVPESGVVQDNYARDMEAIGKARASSVRS
jgi:hypothetical protein